MEVDLRKFRIQRIAAITAATALLLCQPGLTGLAQDTETESGGEPVTEIVTEPPTQAPTEPVTEAPAEPVTEAPTEPATEAPTEPAAQAPTESWTEAPVPVQTETSDSAQGGDILDDGASEDDAAETSAPETEKTDEAQTEKPAQLLELDDDEETVSGLSAQAGDLEVRLTLPEGAEVSADATLKVTEILPSDGDVYKNAMSLVREKTDKGHRALTELYLYRIELVQEDETISLEGEAELSFAWSSLISPGLTPWMQSEAFAFRIGDSAEELCEISLSADEEDHRGFTGFEISGEDLSLIGVAGVENRAPGSGRKTKKELQQDLKDLKDYAAAANRLAFEESVLPDEPFMAGEIVTGSGEADGTEKTETTDQAKMVEAVLEVAALTGLKIADSAPSEEVSFVTVYADEEGNIDEEPLGAWLKQTEDGKEVLDVTDSLLVINIAANDAQQDLELPEWDVYVRRTERGEEDDFGASDNRKAKEEAGRVLYNLVAEDGNKLTKYEGELTVKEDEKGTILAPQAKVILEKDAVGAVYADQVLLKKQARLEQAAFAEEEKEPETSEAEETVPVEIEPEELTEEESEEPAEEESEAPAEGENEAPAKAFRAVSGEEESEEPTEEELFLSADLDAPRLEAEEQVKGIRFTVNAFLGETGNTPLPVNFTFGIYDEEDNPVRDLDGNQLTRTIQAGNGKISFLIDASYEKVFKGGVFYVKPIGNLTDYALLSTSPEKVNFSPDGAGVDSDTVEFRYKAGQYFTLDIRARQEIDGKMFSRTASYHIEDEGENKLKRSDGTELKIELQDGKDMRFVPNVDNYPLFASIKPEERRKFFVVQDSISSPWTAVEDRIPFWVYKDENGEFSVYTEENTPHYGKTDPLELKFEYYKLSFSVDELDAETENALYGGKIGVCMADGTPLVLQAGNETGTFVTLNRQDGGIVSILVDGNEALSEALKDPLVNSVELTVTAITAPTDPSGYIFAGSTTASLTVMKNSSGEKPTVTVASDTNPVTFYFTKVGLLSTDEVKVTKYLYLGEDTGLYHTKEHAYYVALFEDEELTQRITDVKTIRFTGSGLTASVVFASLPAGTYYVGETDAYGNPVGRETNQDYAGDPFYVDYSTQKVTVSSITTKTIPVQMNNHYFELPKEDCNYYRRIRITKNVTDENGNPKKSRGTFYFRINNDTKNIQKITLNNQSSGSKDVYLKASKTTEYKITEVQPKRKANGTIEKKNGNYVYEDIKDNKAWKVSYENNPAVFKSGETTDLEVTVTNMEVNSKSGGSGSDESSGSGVSTETSSGKPSDTATISMVKKTTYKGNPVRLNSTFYIGVFEDAALTKLRSKPVKMTLSNASEKKRSMTVNLYLLEKNSRTVTLYFAETDSDGKVLTSKNSAYDISPEGGVKVTVDPQHPEATVTFTNNITVGSAAEKRLLDPSSGLAGDDTAVDDSARGIGGDGSSGQSGTAAKTGDETPVGLWIMTLLCACLVAWLMTGQRKKGHKGA